MNNGQKIWALMEPAFGPLQSAFLRETEAFDRLVDYYRLNEKDVKRLRAYFSGDGLLMSAFVGGGSVAKADIVQILLRSHGVIVNASDTFKNQGLSDSTYRRATQDLEDQDPPVIACVRLCGKLLIFFHPDRLREGGTHHG